MVYFFQSGNNQILYVISSNELDKIDIEKLNWLFENSQLIKNKQIEGEFIGPRKEMITPWSTNAVEICQNMGIKGIERIERFFLFDNSDFDPMMEQKYKNLDEKSLYVNAKAKPIEYIKDIIEYNKNEGLALSDEEIDYLEDLSNKIQRPLTDSEIFGFSQINSEHCRHKIFNGTFIIDGQEQVLSLFQLIRKTSSINKNQIVSAYSDNVAFIKGPQIFQFAPEKPDSPEFFNEKKIESVISLKAETHNFPTTVEPFNGAATGSGGEIRDRMAGGKGSFPLSGSAVYMSSYPRLRNNNKCEMHSDPRKWLYHDPAEILIKASNGASDFGNKFGQPLTCGSLLTFEYFDDNNSIGYDKVIMLAGGVGYANANDSLKDIPNENDTIIVMGGDNYRIGMGGGAVSSVSTGQFSNTIELNAVQRSNPEMQKRVYNVIRALSEMENNPIVSIHDHGAGGHLNSLSELVDSRGGVINIEKLPVGDITLSYKEILSNESQERMGLVIDSKYYKLLKQISERERAPVYEIGVISNDQRFQIKDNLKQEIPFDLSLNDLFGNVPHTILIGKTYSQNFKESVYNCSDIYNYTTDILKVESVACKDWLTNKVDRSVSGRVAMQQTAGILQLPLNNLSITTLDYRSKKGIANAIGHAPIIAINHPEIASRIAVAEALTNIIWTPVEGGIKGISLSANWMWSAKSEYENAKLYRAVQAISNFAIELGINIPTGKDSLSMTQKYPDGKIVSAPGTVIVSAVGQVSDFSKSVTPVLKIEQGTKLLYIDFSESEPSIDFSTFSTIFNNLGNNPPDIKNTEYFLRAWHSVQELIQKKLILAGHDISAGGKITSLLEMTFSSDHMALELDLSNYNDSELIKFLFSENPGVFIQVKNVSEVNRILSDNQIKFTVLGNVIKSEKSVINLKNDKLEFITEKYRDIWYETSFLFDVRQTKNGFAQKRFENYKNQKLRYIFPAQFSGKYSELRERKINAAIIREKGINGDREMAFALYLAGFNVKDVHMTDLATGRETLEEINMLVFPGGFSNSDVLGSAKGWAGAFLYNEKAKKAIENFYKRSDTLSLGVCNGCQLMMALNLIHPELEFGPKMEHNDSGKFESAFLTVDIKKSPSIMLKTLEGSRLGVWVAHGEGKFRFPSTDQSDYNISMKYSFDDYPGNPNGSDFSTAAICSSDGRHLAMMPHIERSVYKWHWPYYDENRDSDEVSPWIEAFVNARKWLENKHIKK